MTPLPSSQVAGVTAARREKPPQRATMAVPGAAAVRTAVTQARSAPAAILGLQRNAGIRAMSELIQRLRVSHARTAVLQRSGSHPCLVGGCESSAADELVPEDLAAASRPPLARTAVPGRHGADVASPLVDGVLRSSGQPRSARKLTITSPDRAIATSAAALTASSESIPPTAKSSAPRRRSRSEAS
jgi:hypothetical protein